MCGFLVSEPKLQDLSEQAKLLWHRGPDHQVSQLSEQNHQFHFCRLAIMDNSEAGNQPFVQEKSLLVCNGEIYNHKILQQAIDHEFTSGSDCEVLLPYFRRFGIERLCKDLDAEFALALYDETSKELILARDPVGIRPLFYGITKTGEYIFASEVKALTEACSEVAVFPPGHWWSRSKGFQQYYKLRPKKTDIKLEKGLEGIRSHFINAVEKRLTSDAPLGFLLSGGLDSSLVCGIGAKLLDKPITTFAVGIKENPIDTTYARVVADYLQSDHHEVLFSFEEVLEELKNVIYHLETYDITTIRASIGMYLVCKYVREKTNIKVLMTGEISDELFGYKYTDYAPSAEEFQEESIKRVREIHMYDVLRCDRSISAHSLEARVPFGDIAFMDHVLSIDPLFKMNTTGVGKYLLRKAFEKDEFIPHEILMREKAAFSDAVGHSMVDRLKLYAEQTITDEQFQKGLKKYTHATPLTKEALMYRDIFETLYPGKSHLVKDFWLPNKNWENCDVIDPSARVLPNYGKSGENRLAI